MNVTNEDKTVIDSIDRFEITSSNCRICFEECDQVWQIFDPANEEIPRKLMEFAAVQVEEGDGLPAAMCENCRHLLDIAHDFKRRVERSDAKLREILMAKISSEEDEKSVRMIITESMENEERGEAVAGGGSNVFLVAPPPPPLPSADRDDRTNDSTGAPLEKLEGSFADFKVGEKPYKSEGTDISEQEEERNACIAEGSEDRIATMIEDDGGCRRTETKSERDEASGGSGCGGDDEQEKALVARTQRYKCPNCIKTFGTRTSFERHGKMHEKKKRAHICNASAEQFSEERKTKSEVWSSEGGARVGGGEDANDVAMGTTTTASKETAGFENLQKSMKFCCKTCGKRFTYEKSLIGHARSHAEDGVGATDERSIVVSSEESNERDRESEEGREDEDDDDDAPLEGLRCTQCGKLFATKRNLKRHFSTHSGFKFHCSACGKEFSRVDKLREHEQSKHRDETFAPSGSDFEFDTDTGESKDRHDGTENRKKDKRNRPYRCPVCPKAFAQEQSLANHADRHKRTKDTRKRFLCEVCSKCFAQSGSLVAHMRTHTGVKPYVCNVCSRAFTKSTYLQLHLRTHSGEKPYICQYCSRAFARANTLARHITMHTGEANYHCQICTKSFRRLTSLNEHTYTHTGQRPYACKICTKRYNNAGSLYAHAKKCRLAATQQSSASTITSCSLPVDNEILRTHTDSRNILHSQRKFSEGSSSVERTDPTSRFLISSVRSIDSSVEALPGDSIPQLTLQDPTFCSLGSKLSKNSYYAIFPNM